MDIDVGATEERSDQPRDGSGAGRRSGITLLALFFALGIALGWHQSLPLVWPWLAGAGACLLAAMALTWRRPGPAGILMLAGAVFIGAGWVTLRYHRVQPKDLAGQLGEDSVLVRIRGVALGEPVLRDPSAGSMGRFDYRAPSTCFPMRCEALLSRTGRTTEVCGEVLVRVEDTVSPFRAGDEIEALGFLSPVGPPHNPGEFDFQRYARSLGQAGILSVPGRSLLQVRPAPRHTLHSTFLNWRQTLRHKAGAWLLADLPASGRTERDALLAALLLGQRGPDLDGLGESFREVGLAHLLAISGLHLGVLIGFVLMLVRSGGAYHRWHGWLVIIIVLAYLVLVEVRLPVLRAAVMIIVASLGLVCGRRWRVGSLVALSAVGLLVWKPDQLFTAGFQLSFGVVLGLIHFTPIVRRRWFGPPDHSPVSSLQMVGEWLRSAFAAAMTAWAIATPIVACHFGFISPMGVLLSVLVLPIVAVLLVVGYVKMVLAVILPSAALLIGAVLSVCTDVLISIVQTADAMPLSVVYVPPPSTSWTIAGLVWVCVWGLYPDHWYRRRRAVWLGGLIVAGWFAVPMLLLRSGPPLRIDMLSVGEGACHIVRSSRTTVLFDAGSSNDLDAGRRTIVPALRHLGVRRIEAIVVSHADMDHYSSVLDVVGAFAVGRVLVTPQLLARAEADPASPVAFLIDGLTDRYVAVSAVSAGEERRFGVSRWKWLHPPADATIPRPNDTSMVIRIECAGRALLLTGDIQDEAISTLLAAEIDADLAADVIELPHHGGYSDLAVQFLREADPETVLQSAGRARLRHDRWEQVPAGPERLITARDGACWVEFDESGRLSTGRFLHSEEQ
ncbi:MAG: ComEC/Rec2 family competence protein [Phycisphaerales bacterium]|nr:MAG: ComEC/Rec2 family competence protein [Phycisphaerales bacterium]